MSEYWLPTGDSGAEFDSPAPFLAEHVRVAPGVFVVSVVVSQPFEDAIPDSLSVTLQLTVTLLWYHPFLPKVPETWGVTSGGVVSV